MRRQFFFNFFFASNQVLSIQPASTVIPMETLCMLRCLISIAPPHSAVLSLSRSFEMYAPKYLLCVVASINTPFPSHLKPFRQFAPKSVICWSAWIRICQTLHHIVFCGIRSHMHTFENDSQPSTTRPLQTFIYHLETAIISSHIYSMSENAIFPLEPVGRVRSSFYLFFS